MAFGRGEEVKESAETTLLLPRAGVYSMLAYPLLLLVQYPESMKALKGIVGLDVPGVPVGTSTGILLAKCGTNSKTDGNLVDRDRCILTCKVQMKPIQSVPSELGNQLASEVG